MTVALPTGTVTFLFTDIEGSTKLLQALGDRYPAILARHHEIVRDAIRAHGGTEVGTEGDSFFVAFPSAPAAVGAAIDAQRALAGEPWSDAASVRVRMGLHTGEGLLQGETYVGLDVHRAARISSAAHGGQVLISATTRSLVDGALPLGVRLREMGEHRLKDLSRPEHLADLVIGGLRSEFPPLRTLDAVPNNLPTQMTSFLGREAELAEAERLLADARLLTMSGPGGTGKTRLALQVAADEVERFPDGVYWVPLGSISEPDLVAPTIAQAMGLPDPGGHAFDRLAEHLGSRRVLLVLDNFEQVAAAAAGVAELLSRAPQLTVLVTSREALHVYGEHEYPVPPLRLPDTHRLADLASFSQYASVALFIERAMAVKPDFAVTNANAPAVAEICVRLDGLPLAIELAAARVRVLSPEAILQRLGGQLALLSGGARDLPARQQTLRGAIAWSYDLLSEPERRLFARISVFAGGATFDGLEAVVPDPGTAVDSMELLDGVGSLVDKSLVFQVPGPDGEPRFGMLNTIREFAAEQAVVAGEHDGLSERHASFYLSFAEAGAAVITGPDQRAILDRFELEHDNLRAALSWATAADKAPTALRLLAGCWRFWQMRGYLAEARDRTLRVLDLSGADADPVVLERALEAAGGIEYWMGEMPAARAYYERALGLARQRGDEHAEADELYNVSFTYSVGLGDSDIAIDLSEQALAIYRRLGDRAAEGRAVWGLVNANYFGRHVDEARRRANEAIAIFTELDNRFDLAWALFLGALVEHLHHDLDRMDEYLRRALELFREANDVSGYALTLDAWATYWFARGDTVRAMRLAGAASTLQTTTQTGLGQLNRESIGFIPKELINDRSNAAAFADGQAMDLEQALRLATEGREAAAPGGG
ncbi:MAG: tetratricopeptide repeat protein [Chloroflexota bacterium]|nr:tetratricopeptide repeat protein [Chloroflexota bacterium]